MIDTHSHLNFPDFDDSMPDVLAQMKQAHVHNAIVVGTDIESSKKAVELATIYDELYAAVGIHPGDATSPAEVIEQLKQLASQARVVAIGEVGMDYKVFNGIEPNRELQQVLFEACIELAKQKALPLVVHSRMAEDDVINILAAHQGASGAVIHCFDATYEIAKKALDAGLMISFTGMLTYPKKDELRAIAQQMPHDRIMVETDCPFLPPQVIRGQRNEPSYVAEVVKVLADLWNKDVRYVDEVTTQNAQRFFQLV